jgi:hypothetical protein
VTRPPARPPACPPVFAALALFLAFTARPTQVSAQQLVSSSLVTCGAPDRGRHECQVGRQGGVVLVRQLGDAECVRGRTWGFAEAVVWTEGGCWAEFRVEGAPGDSAARAPFRILCESVGGQRTECLAAPRARVVLVRQLSRAPCREGTTWGTQEGKVWVTQGCRAEFEVRAG